MTSSTSLRCDLTEIARNIKTNHESEIAIEKIKANPLLVYSTDLRTELSLLAYAIQCDNQTVIDFLLEQMDHDVLLFSHRSTSIMMCVLFGSILTLRKLMTKFPDTIDTEDAFGQTALFHTRIRNHHEKAEILLQAGAKAYRGGPHGIRFLMNELEALDDKTMMNIFNKYIH